jgi:subtilisin family serine protease
VRIVFCFLIDHNGICLVDSENGNKRKLHRSPPNYIRIAESLQAPKLWKMGHRGAGIHVAVFDTGIQDGHPHFPNIAEVTNWTDEKDDHDSMKKDFFSNDDLNKFHFSYWSWIICCRCYW